MRISRKELQDLINEEISRSLLKTENRRLMEHLETGVLYETDVFELLEFAKAYSDLGTVIRKQLEDLLNTGGENINSSAVEIIERELGGRNREIDESLQDWKSNH